MLVTKSIPGLFNGVSQQAPTLRLETQAELQENAMSLLVDGLTKRPNTEWIANLQSNADSGAFFHPINRDPTEQYMVVITGDQNEPIEVFTRDGTPCTVLYEGNAKDYVTLPGIKPREDLKAVTVADHTILINRKIVPEMDPETTPNGENGYEAIVWVKQGVPSCDYRIEIYVDGAQVAQTVYTTGDTDDPDSFKTNTIVDELVEGLESVLTHSRWSVESLRGALVIRSEDLAFDIRITDSYGNQAMAVAKGSVQKFTDLPPIAPNGMILSVTGDDETGFGRFYVKFVKNEESTSGVWEETVAPGLPFKFKPETMPHRLIRSGFNEFTLTHIEWEERTVGDDNSSPVPSFCENPINDVFFFKNRLGFLSGENVILSRASDFWNFWPATATDVLDSDPIDVAVSTNRVAVLQHAIPFVNTLLLFSEQQQFTLSAGAGILTPQSVVVDPSTSFETSRKCRPVGAGPNVYFVSPNGDHSSVREYFVQPNTQINDAADVTAHVPRYLPKDVLVMDASSANNIVFAFSPVEENTLYVYKYHWEGEEKAQSSWSKWIFDDKILTIAVLENFLYLVMKKDDIVSLCRINLETTTTGSLPFRVHLDKRAEVQGIYDSEAGETTWTLPYSDSSDQFQVIDSNKGTPIQGVVKVDDSTLKAPGDFSEYPCYIGKPYVKRYRFSRWYLRGSSGVAQTQGQLRLRTLVLNFTDSGYFRLEVYPRQREPMVSIMTGVKLGESFIGSPGILSGEHRAVLFSNAWDTEIDIVNDSYLPSTIQSAELEGFWITRARPW